MPLEKPRPEPGRSGSRLRPGDEEPGAVSLEKNAAPRFRSTPTVVAVVQLVEPRARIPEASVRGRSATFVHREYRLSHSARRVIPRPSVGTNSHPACWASAEGRCDRDPDRAPNLQILERCSPGSQPFSRHSPAFLAWRSSCLVVCDCGVKRANSWRSRHFLRTTIPRLRTKLESWHQPSFAACYRSREGHCIGNLTRPRWRSSCCFSAPQYLSLRSLSVVTPGGGGAHSLQRRDGPWSSSQLD